MRIGGWVRAYNYVYTNKRIVHRYRTLTAVLWPCHFTLFRWTLGYGKPEYCHYTQTDIKTFILLSNFHDQRTTSNPGQKFVLSHATQSHCIVCVKWKVHMVTCHLGTFFHKELTAGDFDLLYFSYTKGIWQAITGIWTPNSVAVSLISIQHQECSFHLLIMTAKPSLMALAMLCCGCVYVGVCRGVEEGYWEQVSIFLEKQWAGQPFYDWRHDKQYKSGSLVCTAEPS